MCPAWQNRTPGQGYFVGQIFLEAHCRAEHHSRDSTSLWSAELSLKEQQLAVFARVRRACCECGVTGRIEQQGRRDVRGGSKMRGRNELRGKSGLRGTARMCVNAEVQGKTEVQGNTEVQGKAEVQYSAKLKYRAKLNCMAMLKYTTVQS